MSFSLFVASRYLTSRTKRTFISIISLMSVIGVAIGVAALVIVMSVYNGVTSEMKDKILGSNPHVLVMAASPGVFNTAFKGGIPEVLEKIKQTPDVLSASTFLYSEVLFSSRYGSTGMLLRGIDMTNPVQLEAILKGRTIPSEKLNNSTENVIIIGNELARRFHLTKGSRVNLMSPAGQKTSIGFVPKIRGFKVLDTFHSGLSEIDARMAYVPIAAAQDLMGYEKNWISGVEVSLKHPMNAVEKAKEISQNLGPSFYTRNWIDTNANLFAALQMERFGMFIVLLMVILVSSFSIITSLVMLVMEKTKDIAILISMGATAKAIRRIFILQGTLIGFCGTALGYIFGIVLALLLKKYQFIQLPQGVYMMDKLPVIIQPLDLLWIGSVSVLLCFLATIYPARQAAGLVPAEALRYE